MGLIRFHLLALRGGEYGDQPLPRLKAEIVLVAETLEVRNHRLRNNRTEVIRDHFDPNLEQESYPPKSYEFSGSIRYELLPLLVNRVSRLV